MVRKRKKDYVGPFGRLYFKNRKNRSNSPTGSAGVNLSKFITSKDLNQDAVRNDSMARRGGNTTNGDISGTTFSLKEMTAEANAVPGERSVYYKDVAIIRESLKDDQKEYFYGYKDSILRIVTDHGFMSIFQKRAAHDYWKNVVYIQTNVKSRIGCGTPIVVKFYAPLDHDNPEAEIAFDYKTLGDEVELIKAGDDYTYCLL